MNFPTCHPNHERISALPMNVDQCFPCHHRHYSLQLSTQLSNPHSIINKVLEMAIQCLWLWDLLFGRAWRVERAWRILLGCWEVGGQLAKGVLKEASSQDILSLSGCRIHWKKGINKSDVMNDPRLVMWNWLLRYVNKRKWSPQQPLKIS
jgi:hypothetical protein